MSKVVRSNGAFAVNDIKKENKSKIILKELLFYVFAFFYLVFLLAALTIIIGG